jgi:hypothetical protein
LGVTGLVWLQAAAAPLALPMRLDPTLLRMGGWDTMAARIEAISARDHAAFVASDNYGHAAVLALLLPPDLPVVGVDDRWSLFDLPSAGARMAGQTGLLLRSARRAGSPDPADWASVGGPYKLDRARDGMTAEAFGLYPVTGREGGPIAALMPRPR